MAKTLPPEVGCYGDGSFGHKHTRERCAELVFARANAVADKYIRRRGWVLAYSLREPMSDDAQEEYDACEWLNEHVPLDGASWGWDNGDFGLWPDDCEF